MQFELKAKAEGDTFLDETIQVSFGAYTITVFKDDRNKISSLSIKTPVDDFRSILPVIMIANDSASTHQLTLPHNFYFDDIISLFQYIESLGGFWFGIQRIHWAEPEQNWIPENEDERKFTEVNQISFSRAYKIDLVKMKSSRLVEILESWDRYKHLVIPLSFYREGRNEFREKRYINAFYNFYFYLEDLYGNGKTKNWQVENEFITSQHINSAAKETLSEFKACGGKHLDDLMSFSRQENCDLDADGLIKLIVKVRGTLHHFSQKSTKKVGHPFNQAEFETIAFVLMSLCAKTYAELTTGDKPR